MNTDFVTGDIKSSLDYKNTYIGEVELDLNIGKNVSIGYQVENDATFRIRTQFFTNILNKEEFKNEHLLKRDYMLNFQNNKKNHPNWKPGITDVRFKCRFNNKFCSNSECKGSIDNENVTSKDIHHLMEDK